MKVFVSVDMEGITGVVAQPQVVEGSPLYDQARRLMVGDVNAATEGAAAGGATDILVNDGHNHMLNLDLSGLDSRARLLLGENKPLLQMEGVRGCDMAFFVGYHSMAGSERATLDHSYWNSLVHSLEINGEAMGELEFNALLAGSYGVPVVLVTGDQATCETATAFIGDSLETAIVKRAVGRQAAVCDHPDITKGRIQDAAERAVRKGSSARPRIVEPPVELRLRFQRSDMADQAAVLPDTKRVDARSVQVEADTVERAYRLMLTMFALARAALSG